MKKYGLISKLLGIAILGTISVSCTQKEQPLHTINIQKAQQMHDYFKRDASKPIIISGHRGGMATGFPENSIESFENTLRHIESFFEIDPRLTKDSVIVLMHDKTLDRTTNGTGKVSDYTYEELRALSLKDRCDNITEYKIPTLAEAIEWSRGKTILNLDKKDVPLEMTAALLREMNAVNVMLTVHSGDEALYYYSQNPDAMFSAHILTMEAYEDYARTGIPWSHFIAYVGRTITPENTALCELLRSNGVMCMISVAPTHDKLPEAEERKSAYLEEMAKAPDIIETDFPIEFTDL